MLGVLSDGRGGGHIARGVAFYYTRAPKTTSPGKRSVFFYVRSPMTSSCFTLDVNISYAVTSFVYQSKHFLHGNTFPRIFSPMSK